VKFKGGLSISILKNTATHYKNLQPRTEKFPKAKRFQRPPLTGACQGFQDDWDLFKGVGLGDCSSELY
jgi:hypothetical protein